MDAHEGKLRIPDLFSSHLGAGIRGFAAAHCVLLRRLGFLLLQ
jgi:hypothetical protein